MSTTLAFPYHYVVCDEAKWKREHIGVDEFADFMPEDLK